MRIFGKKKCGFPAQKMQHNVLRPVHRLQNAKKNAVFPVHMFVAFPVAFLLSEFYISLIRISNFQLHLFGQSFIFFFGKISHFFVMNSIPATTS